MCHKTNQTNQGNQLMNANYRLLIIYRFTVDYNLHFIKYMWVYIKKERKKETGKKERKKDMRKNERYMKKERKKEKKKRDKRKKAIGLASLLNGI